MLQSYQAVIEHGQLKWLDTPPQVQNARLIVTLLPDDLAFDELQTYDLNKKGEKRFGFMQGQGAVPDDIHWGDDEVAKLFGVD